MRFDCIKTLDTESRIRKVRFNIDGAYCMSCGSDKKIKLWNPYQERLLKTYSSHGDEVLDVDASCDSSQLVSGSSDKSVILWDVSTGQVLRRLRKHAGFVTAVKFNEDSSVVVSGSQDNTVACWDLKSRSPEPIQILNDAQDTITSLQVNDHEILTGSADNNVRLYDLRNGKMTVDFLGAIVTSVCLTSDNMCHLSSCNDNSIKLIDKSTGQLLNEYTGHNIQDYSSESCLSSDGRLVVGGSVNGEVFIWDFLTAKVLSRLTHGVSAVQTLNFHPKNDVFLTGSITTVKLWQKVEEIVL